MEVIAVREKTARRKSSPEPLAVARAGKTKAARNAASVNLIHLHGQPLGDGTSPLICTPLVGRTREALLGELAIVLAKKPDLIEWRVDFFEGIGNTPMVIELAGSLKQAAGDIPIIFTRRSMNEGGERIALDEDDVVKLYVAACASGCVDIIDYELSNPAENLARLRNTSRDNDVAMIMSYHNFQSTPDAAAVAAKFTEAARQGADIAKVCPELRAVFARGLEKDVEALRKDVRMGDRILRLTVFTVELGSIVGGVLQDITEPAVQREQIIQQAQDVIRKNVTTVQQIAFLLGENAAETEMMLNSLSSSFRIAPSPLGGPAPDEDPRRG